MDEKKQQPPCASEPKAKTRVEDERAKRPLMYGLLDVDNFIKKFRGVTYFVTMNPYKKGKRFTKLQQIGAACDVLRKYSSHFLIVREYNPDGTSHYHAICAKFNTEKAHPKHMTFHVMRVGGDAPSPVFDPEKPPTTVEDYERWEVVNPLLEELGCHHHLLDATTRLLSYIWRKQRKAREALKRKTKKEVRASHVGRVIDYMSKSFECDPREYSDYIYYCRKAM